MASLESRRSGRHTNLEGDLGVRTRVDRSFGFVHPYCCRECAAGAAPAATPAVRGAGDPKLQSAVDGGRVYTLAPAPAFFRDCVSLPSGGPVPCLARRPARNGPESPQGRARALGQRATMNLAVATWLPCRTRAR